MAEWRWAIGKKPRHIEGDFLNYHPYLLTEPTYDWYKCVRASTFGSRETAELAAQLCTRRNPVGFVVVRVKVEEE